MFLPNEWEIKKLGTFTRIAAGCSPSQLRLTEIGRYPFFKVEELNYAEKYLLNSRSYCTEADASLVGQFLLLPKRGAAIFLNKLRIYEGVFQVDTNLMALEFDKEVSCVEFMFYKLVAEGLDKIADTSSIPQINNKHIQPYQVALPPLPEQKKIARILSSVDSKLALIDQRITTTQTLKKGLMQKLFTQGVGTQDADGQWQPHTEFQGTEMKLAENGLISKTASRIPDGWKSLKLGDIFSVKSGDFLPKNKMEPGTVPVYGGNGISGYHAQANTQGPKLIIGRVGAYCGAVYLSGNNSWITDNALFINEKHQSFDDKFGLFLLEHLNLNSYAAQSAQPLISGKLLSEIKTNLPPLPEQQEIARILSTVDRKLEHLQTQKNQTQQLKKGLMQKLLTGQIRVQPDPQDH